MNKFDKLFEIASSISFSNYVIRPESNLYGPTVTLSKNQIDKLTNKLQSLPEKYIHILFLYHNNIKVKSIEQILNTENIVSYINYLNQLLSESIGLENSLISFESMKSACNKLIEHDILKLPNNINIEDIQYSKKFKREINKLIPHCITVKSHPILKKIAVILIVIITSTTSIFTFDATARQKLVNWLIKTFPKYSEFWVNDNNSNSSYDLDKYKVTYLPTGFTLSSNSILESSITERYQNNSNQYILFFKKSSDNSPILLNTEGTNIELYMHNNIEYMYWEKNGVYNVTWQKDGYAFNLNTNIDKNTCIKISINVKKQ